MKEVDVFLLREVVNKGAMEGLLCEYDNGEEKEEKYIVRLLRLDGKAVLIFGTIDCFSCGKPGMISTVLPENIVESIKEHNFSYEGIPNQKYWNEWKEKRKQTEKQ